MMAHIGYPMRNEACKGVTEVDIDAERVVKQAKKKSIVDSVQGCNLKKIASGNDKPLKQPMNPKASAKRAETSSSYLLRDEFRKGQNSLHSPEKGRLEVQSDLDLDKGRRIEGDSTSQGCGALSHHQGQRNLPVARSKKITINSNAIAARRDQESQLSLIMEESSSDLTLQSPGCQSPSMSTKKGKNIVEGVRKAAKSLGGVPLNLVHSTVEIVGNISKAVKAQRKPQKEESDSSESLQGRTRKVSIKDEEQSSASSSSGNSKRLRKEWITSSQAWSNTSLDCHTLSSCPAPAVLFSSGDNAMRSFGSSMSSFTGGGSSRTMLSMPSLATINQDSVYGFDLAISNHSNRSSTHHDAVDNDLDLELSNHSACSFAEPPENHTADRDMRSPLDDQYLGTILDCLAPAPIPVKTEQRERWQLSAISPEQSPGLPMRKSLSPVGGSTKKAITSESSAHLSLPQRQSSFPDLFDDDFASDSDEEVDDDICTIERIAELPDENIAEKPPAPTDMLPMPAKRRSSFS